MRYPAVVGTAEIRASKWFWFPQFLGIGVTGSTFPVPISSANIFPVPISQADARKIRFLKKVEADARVESSPCGRSEDRKTNFHGHRVDLIFS